MNIIAYYTAPAMRSEKRDRKMGKVKFPIHP
jgi:hypothetical protein